MTYASLFVFALFIWTRYQNVNMARILAVIPTATYSHQMFFQPLWRELAIRGHDMVVITTHPTGESLPNFKEVSIAESRPHMKRIIDTFLSENIFKLMMTNAMNELYIDMIDYQLSLPQVKDIINNRTEHFDLVMIEHVMPIVYAFKHRFKCPMIGVTSMEAFQSSHATMGNAVHSLLYPMPFLPFSDQLTFFQRFSSVLIFGQTFEFMRIMNVARIMDVTRQHFGDTHGVPLDIAELVNDIDMLFVNANPLFSSIRPYTPSTISIAGGIHMKPQQPLPKNLNDFLDSAQKGIIYFSLGSNMQSKDLPVELRQIIMDTLAQVPYKVLWKFEDDALPGKPDNVKIIKWAPQQDVLRHPNVKLFVTQGGIQSLEEALYSHVPLVVIPFFGDQFANAEKVKVKGLGLVQNSHNINIEDFKAKILDVIENSTYRNTVQELAERIQDEPMKPLDKAIWWTEYVLRHKGAQHLKGPIIPFYQYYYFDVLVFLAFITILFLGTCKLIIIKIGMINVQRRKLKQL